MEKEEMDFEMNVNLALLDSMEEIVVKKCEELINYSEIISSSYKFIRKSCAADNPSLIEIKELHKKYENILHRIRIKKKDMKIENCNIQKITSNSIINLRNDYEKLEKDSEKDEELFKNLVLMKESIKEIKNSEQRIKLMI